MLGRVAAEFVEAYPADAARILEAATTEVVGEALGSLPAPVAAAVLRAMAPHAASSGLAHVAHAAPGPAAEIVRRLPIEIASALLLRLDAGVRGRLMAALPARASVPLRMVLRFPPGSVGSLIDPRVVTVRAETRVAEAAETARRTPSLLRKYLYVLDDTQRLIGIVDARQCLIRDPALPIGRLERETMVALRARSSLREAGRNPGWERFGVLPATDHRGVFLGVVRRTTLRRALAAGASPEPEVELADLALDLADLYWQTAASFIAGTPATGARDGDAP